MKSGNRKGIIAAAVLSAAASFGFTGAQRSLETPVQYQYDGLFRGKHRKGRYRSRLSKRKRAQATSKLNGRQRRALKQKHRLTKAKGTLTVWTSRDPDTVRELRGLMGAKGMRRVRRLTGGNRTRHVLMDLRSNVAA